MRKTLAVICLLLMSLYLNIAQGQALWIDRNSIGGPCSDDRSREEVSQTSPWCTLGMAGSKVEAGDTVWVREGDYTEVQDTATSNDNAVLQLTVSGRSDAWIRILAAEGEKVSITPRGKAAFGITVEPTLDQRVRPKFIEIAGFEIRDTDGVCIEVFDTSDVVLRDLDVHDCRHSAVELENTQRVTLESSSIHDNPLNGNTSAVDLFKCGGGNVVRGNRIWGNTDRNHEEEGHGVIMDTCLGGGGAVIEDNVIFENQGWCIVIFASDNAQIRNNVCKNNGTGSPTSFGHTIGEITTVGSFIDITDNIAIPRDGSMALSIRAMTDIWNSNWSTLNIKNNIFWSPTHDKIIGIGSSEPVTVAQYQETYNPWGVGDRQIDPKLDGQTQGGNSENDDSTVNGDGSNDGAVDNGRSRNDRRGKKSRKKKRRNRAQRNRAQR